MPVVDGLASSDQFFVYIMGIYFGLRGPYVRKCKDDDYSQCVLERSHTQSRGFRRPPLK